MSGRESRDNRSSRYGKRGAPVATKSDFPLGHPFRPISRAALGGGATHMLICALDYVGSASPLTCSTDGKNMYALARASGIADVDAMFNEQCSKEAIVAAIQKMALKCNPGDTFFFFFAGHGMSSTDFDGDEPDGKDENYVCDFTNQRMDPHKHYLSDDEFSSLLTRCLSKQVDIVVVSDCCHSGSVCDFSKVCWKGYNAISISGCRDNQTSGDTGKGGICTHSMMLAIEQLQKERKTSYSVGELFRKTVYFDDTMMSSSQDIQFDKPTGCNPNSINWPLIPKEPFTAPYHNGNGLLPGAAGMMTGSSSSVAPHAVSVTPTFSASGALTYPSPSSIMLPTLVSTGKRRTDHPLGRPFRSGTRTGGTTRMLICALDYLGSACPLTCSIDGKNMYALAQASGVMDVEAMYNEQCGKEAIIAAITRTAQRCNPGDTFVFFFAGHGMSSTDYDGDEPDGKDENYVCDFTNQRMDPRKHYLSDDEFSRLLTKSFSPQVNIIVLSDCCHSGSVCDFARMCWKGYNAVSISGCRDSQTSGDTGKGGICTHSMMLAIEQLQKEQQTDYSVGQLYRKTVYFDDTMMSSSQDIQFDKAPGCNANSISWPLIPKEQFSAPYRSASGLLSGATGMTSNGTVSPAVSYESSATVMKIYPTHSPVTGINGPINQQHLMPSFARSAAEPTWQDQSEQAQTPVGLMKLWWGLMQDQVDTLIREMESLRLAHSQLLGRLDAQVDVANDNIIMTNRLEQDLRTLRAVPHAEREERNAAFAKVWDALEAESRKRAEILELLQSTQDEQQRGNLQLRGMLDEEVKMRNKSHEQLDDNLKTGLESIKNELRGELELQATLVKEVVQSQATLKQGMERETRERSTLEASVAETTRDLTVAVEKGMKNYISGQGMLQSQIESITRDISTERRDWGQRRAELQSKILQCLNEQEHLIAQERQTRHDQYEKFVVEERQVRDTHHEVVLERISTEQSNSSRMMADHRNEFRQLLSDTVAEHAVEFRQLVADMCLQERETTKEAYEFLRLRLQEVLQESMVSKAEFKTESQRLWQAIQQTPPPREFSTPARDFSSVESTPLRGQSCLGDLASSVEPTSLPGSIGCHSMVSAKLVRSTADQSFTGNALTCSIQKPALLLTETAIAADQVVIATTGEKTGQAVPVATPKRMSSAPSAPNRGSSGASLALSPRVAVETVPMEQPLASPTNVQLGQPGGTLLLRNSSPLLRRPASCSVQAGGLASQRLMSPAQTRSLTSLGQMNRPSAPVMSPMGRTGSSPSFVFK